MKFKNEKYTRTHTDRQKHNDPVEVFKRYCLIRQVRLCRSKNSVDEEYIR